jgi:CBS domain-containing protein
MQGTVTEYMTADVVTATPSMTLKQVDQALIKNGITGMPVVDDGTLVGVVSQSDIVRTIYDEQLHAQRVKDIYQSPFPIPLSAIDALASDTRKISQHIVSTTVQEVMSPVPVSVEVDTPVDEVARLMVTERIHRVLVTDRNRLVGIISSLDLVNAMIEPTED